MAHQVTVMPTYAGDFNLDGVVNDQDFDIWMSHAGTGTTWQTGDVYDGVVNGLDLDLWRANVGLPNLAVPCRRSSGAWNSGAAGRWLVWFAGLRVEKAIVENQD